MDANSPLENVALGDCLNAACYTIADAIVRGSIVLGIEIPGVLSFSHVEDYIPGEVLELAVNAGWLPEPFQPEKEDDGIALGKFFVEDQYDEWFRSLLADAICDLRVIAEKNSGDENFQRIQRDMTHLLLTYRLQDALKQPGIESVHPIPESVESTLSAEPQTIGGRGRELIDKYFDLNHEVFRHFQLAHLASLKRKKLDGGNVTGTHISRIYNGEYIGPEAREAVALVLSTKVPCTRFDLLPAGWAKPEKLKANETSLKPTETD